MDFSHVVDAYSNSLVPIGSLDRYETLCQHVAWEIAAKAGGTGILIADKLTFDQHTSRIQNCAEGGNLWITGAKNARASRSTKKKVPETFRSLIFVSPRLSLALVGIPSKHANKERTDFTGGWTCSRQDVCGIIKAIHDGEVTRPLPQFPFPAADATDTTLALAQKLLVLQTSPHPGLNKGIDADKTDLLHVLSILRTISERGTVSDILFDFVAHIARIIEVDRCSVVRVWKGEDRLHVLASHEDPGVRDVTLDLAAYPEIRQTLTTRAKVVITDAATDPLVRDVEEALKKARIRSIVVAPLILHDEEIGSLLLRVARRDRAIQDREIQFYEIVAEAAGTALERAHLVEKIETSNERLTYLATTDGLTSLYNHRFFRERLEEEFERAKRYKLPLSCIMADIDDFKKINDVFGHLRGDNVLCDVAKCIMRAVRKSDVVARYGGEEFAVILPQTDREGAVAEAERLLRMVSTHHFTALPNDARITLSLGVGVLDVVRMSDADTLLKVADNALYKAKTTGKNRICLGELD
jgi:diguanylate cyclase (GGDEF)-like protein